MPVSSDQVLAELHDKGRAEVEAGAEGIYNEYLTLQELRKVKKMTQMELFRRLNKKQKILHCADGKAQRSTAVHSTPIC